MPSSMILVAELRPHPSPLHWRGEGAAAALTMIRKDFAGSIFY